MVDTQSSSATRADVPIDGGADVTAAPTMRQSAEQIEAVVTRLREGLSSLSLTSRYTRDELDTIYALAWSHLTRRQADTALRLFLFLTDYAPIDATYLMGLGVCLQQLERHRDALATFSWVGVLDADSVEASLRSAECLLALKEREEAERLLDLIVADATASSSKPTQVAYRAQALLDVLRRGIDGSGAVINGATVASLGAVPASI
ncbi:tetratricopeptide repeat protein [Robbsia sp. KACC 23696]|uniref:tetratricopeptide repeat protein n=1 Tax=Robbsia sp. KACC 23696 TaxID=3149231 RepID=UPI00325A5092